LSAAVRKLWATIGDCIVLARDQGADCLTVKTKLRNQVVRFLEWLPAHVPNLPGDTAAKYERIANEQLTEPRECVFAFLPKKEVPKIERMKPSKKKLAWAAVHRLENQLRDLPRGDAALRGKIEGLLVDARAKERSYERA